ncbi:zf-ZPR1-domain-containing protein [Pisolithus marmoratus]|nr:zf-ZPR1-domain-containing protein [Pisolithus marmoratus]
MPQNQFFPSIGQLAQNADASPGDAPDARAQIDDRPLEEVQSLCMQCGEQGVTRMMLTSIPYFKEVIVMSFRCEHCGATNNEIQSAGTIKPEGVLYTLKVLHRADLDRQIVRSEACTVEIPDFELQLPPSRGQLTTLEGLLRDIAADLSADQPVRRILDEAAYTKIQQIVDGIKEVLGDEEEVEDEVDEVTRVSSTAEKNKEDPVKKVITIKLNDPSGNSFVEFLGSMSDPKWTFKRYARNVEQNRALGLLPPEEPSIDEEDSAKEKKETDGEGTNEEIYEFPGVCSRCTRPLVTRMKKVSIPYFKDTLIMSTNCENCGYRDNEVKSGGAISEKGKRITLRVEDREDLSRDILKSETCGLTIPEIDLALQSGTLGGRFTTVEGILEQVYEELSEKVHTVGDSGTMVDEDRQKFQDFLKQLKERNDILLAQITNADKPFTLIMDDPLANSYLQNLYAPDPDPNMEIVTYDRTWQQNEELGLNDMKVENYIADDANELKEEKTIEEVVL